MEENESVSPENAPFDPRSYRSLDEKDGFATASWYLVAAGVIAIILAAICLVLDRTGNLAIFTRKDFVLNPRVAGRGLLFFGILCYAAGRAIAYWRRFSRRGRDRTA
jgi:hypothetical protein